MSSLIVYPDFSTKTEFCSFRIFFPAPEKRQFFVPPAQLAMMSPDYFQRTCFDMAYEEARNGELLLKEVSPEEVLEFLQCTVPTSGTWPKPISVENFPVLAKLADRWRMTGMMQPLAQCIVDEFPRVKTDLKKTLEMLEIAIQSRFSPAVLAKLMGRAAAFGAKALFAAGIMDMKPIRDNASIGMVLIDAAHDGWPRLLHTANTKSPLMTYCGYCKGISPCFFCTRCGKSCCESCDGKVMCRPSEQYVEPYTTDVVVMVDENRIQI